MWNDPIVAWLIALVVCTIYGYFTYQRGVSQGSSFATTLMARAVLNSGRMSAKELEQRVRDEYDKIMNPPAEDEEE